MTDTEDWQAYGPVLVVVAHPDDSEFLFGATVARLVSAGAVVYYLICTNGTQGSTDAGAHDGEIIARRYAEQRAAAAVLGVEEVTFLGKADGALKASRGLRLAITRQIRIRRPRLVLTHFPQRVLDLPIEASHPDHIAVGAATLDAVYPDAGNWRACAALAREGLDPHHVNEIWLPGYQHPNHFVDATAFLDKKVEAIRCHHSQLGEGAGQDADAPPWVYEWMREAGRAKGYEYAEHFKRINLG